MISKGYFHDQEMTLLTLNIRNALLQNLLQLLGILQLLSNLTDDGLRQFSLLPLLDLSFVAHP